MKRYFYLIFFPIALIAQTATAPSSGDGSSGDPYQIDTLNNLYWITQNSGEWDAYYIQTANIDASSSSSWDSNAGFTPIGNSSTRFTGSYDGDGYTIDSLFIDRPTTNDIGLFGHIGVDANSATTIQNLGLTNVSITGNSEVGALVGKKRQGMLTVSNCYSTGSVTGTNSNAGGLVGQLRDGGAISNCYSTCTVNGDVGVGGLVGSLRSNSSNVVNCYSTGSVNGNNFVGGLVGFLNNSSVSNSFWDTQTSGQSSSAAGTGKTTAQMKTASTFTNSGWDFELETTNGTDDYWDMDNVNSAYNSGYPFLSWENGDTVLFNLPPQATFSPANNANDVARDTDITITFTEAILNGDASDITDTNVDGLITLKDTDASGTDIAFDATINAGKTVITINPTSNLNYEQTVYVAIDSGQVEDADGYELEELVSATFTTVDVTSTIPSGAGTSTDPYLIASLANLYWLSQSSADWDKYYKQTVDIDASFFNFSPIGNSSTRFTGSYDGDGYTIDSLFIDRPTTNYIGLFGYIGGDNSYTGSTTIQNLGLTNVSITGKDQVGALVGFKRYGTLTVSNCYSTGSVTGSGTSGSFIGIGGLVGLSYSITLSNCYSTCTVNGGNDVGGLGGYIRDGSSVSNCYSTGSVTGSGINVGGLVGKLHLSTTSVSNCYSTGSVTGSSDSVGGLVGVTTNGATVSNSFWDRQTSGMITSYGGEGLSTTEMMDAYTFCSASWDFEEDENGNDNGTTGGANGNGTENWWDMVQDGNHYPVLSWQNGDTVLVTDLTNECLTDNGGCGDPAYNICTNNIGAPPTCYDIVASGGDLIVDQNSINQYEQDNYVLFDAFDFHGSYQGSMDGAYPDPSDRIYLPDSFPILGNQFTIEARVFSDGQDNNFLNHRTIIGNDVNPSGNDPDRPPTITFQYEDQIRYGFGTGSSGIRFDVSNVRTDNEWVHIAFTFDSDTCKLYVNGELVHSSGNAAGMTPSQVPISLIGRKFQGKIDEVRIWDIARTQTEIQVVMNDTLSGDEAGLVAYYPMDVNENWELIDHSPNENHATITDGEILQKYYSNNCPAPDGSYDCPYPTIRGALENVEAGYNITIKEGRYSEVLFGQVLNASYETEGPKITIEGENDNVILDGTIAINANWEYSNGRYTAQVDLNDISKRVGATVEDIYGLWVDDRYMIPAMPVNFTNPTDPTTGNQNNAEEGTVWDLWLTAPYEWANMVQDAYEVGDIDNLDGLEEWSFDKENNTLHLIAGENIPDSTNVRIRIRSNILHFIYSDNFEFKNLHFFAGAFRFDECSFILFEDSKFSHSMETGMTQLEVDDSNWGKRGNLIFNGTNNTIRNCIFQYINDAYAMRYSGSMYPLLENILFQYNDWYKNKGWYPSVDRNCRECGGHPLASPTSIWGPDIWRYITVDQVAAGGIFPGFRSLTEYVLTQNIYLFSDGSGIQRNVGSTVESTTRYCWLLNTNRNGMRWDSFCAGTDADVHHVVSLGNKKGFRLKGDRHEAYHLISYDHDSKDISLPRNKYCGDNWGEDQSENMMGNLNSQIHNAIAHRQFVCNSPDCGDPNITEGDPQVIADIIGPEFLLNESGIWYGTSLQFAYPHLELQDPWSENRTRPIESLESQFGENPFENNIQNFDFRPRKGSVLIDGGVVIPGINDGQDMDFNHPPLYSGENRAFVGDAPDIGAYEYGDSVYWIPGYRYSYPSVPIPSDGAVGVSMEYGLAFNYPWKTDYSGTAATVTVSGPGINRTESFQYPNNVLFETFLPGETYNWSVIVDGVSSDIWTFTTSDKEYPLNDRSLDTTIVDSMLIPYQIKNLQVSNNNLAFLKFDVPSSINNSCIIHLNLVPEEVETLAGGIVVYKYNYTGWGEKLDENNIGLVDHSLLTPIDTLYTIEAGVPIAVNISDIISSNGVHSFALGVLDSVDHVTFYSKEKQITDGELIGFDEEGYLGDQGSGSGYAPQTSVWPSLTFQPADAPVLATIEDQTTNEDTATSVILSATDINGDSFTFTASSADTNVITTVSIDTLTLTPAANWNGQAAITVIVTDNGLGTLSDTISFTFTVNAINDSPVLTAALPDVTIDEDDFGAVIIPALEAHFVDIDEGDILSYTGSALGEGLDSLSFSTDDGFNAMGRMVNYHGARIMTIKRSAIKKHPARKGFSPLQNNRDKSVKQDIMSFNEDSGIIDTRKNRSTSKGALQQTDKDLFAKQFVIIDSDIIDTRENRSLSRTDSTALIVYPTENFVGDIVIVIVGSDTTGEYAVDTLTLTIENINDAPFVANAIADFEVDEDSAPVTLNINGVFDDVDIAVGDSLTTTAVSLADTLVTVDYDSNSVPMLVFAENGNGETDIIVTAADLFGLTASDTVHVSILSVNDAPSSFALNEQDSVYIAMANFDSDSIVFTWDESADVDEDELSYHFTAELIINGQLTTEYDTTLTANAMKIDYQSVFDEIYAAQSMLAAIEWDVSVSDGVEEVMAENGPLTVGVNASDAVLSIDEELLPEVYALHQNYPNPFNPITKLQYELPENSFVNITVYDLLGKKVKTLVNTTQDAGFKSVIWNATNDYGKPISAGMYLYQIRAGEFVQTRKMLLLK